MDQFISAAYSRILKSEFIAAIVLGKKFFYYDHQFSALSHFTVVYATDSRYLQHHR